MFPLNRINDIKATPSQFKLLEQVPLLSIDAFPYALNPEQGDEISIVVIDTETTGVSDTDEMIEFGWVKATYSPSAKTITQLTESGSMYQQPSQPIPEIITEITGITDEKVAGQSFDLQKVKAVLTDDSPIVIAHNAAFDEKLVSRTFGNNAIKGASIKWACSLHDINWNAKKFNSKKLELLLLESGYFYPAHRADIDCLALTFLLLNTPDVLPELITNVNTQKVNISAYGAPFEVKDILKENGFKWESVNKRVWQIIVPENETGEIKKILDSLYRFGGQQARIEPISIAKEY